MPEAPLLVDLHISPLTCKNLRTAGYAVMRVSDVLAPRSRDIEIIRYARDHGCVIVTQGLDFTALVARSGEKTPSIISLRLENATPDRVTTILLNVLPGIGTDLKHGALVTIDERGVRIRKLPVGSEE